jgi:hypothetical protein
VAFTTDGFPFGFSIYRPGAESIAEVAREFPRAARIELMDTAEWKAQLDIHAGKTT